MRRHFSLLVAATTVFTAGTVAPAAFGSGLRGTVVRRDARRHTFVIATHSGRLLSIRAGRTPEVGRIVRIAAHRPAAAGYTAHRLHVSVRRWHARIRGTVTSVNATRTAFRLARRGASVVVRTPASAPPRLGSHVDVRVWIDKHGRLFANRLKGAGLGAQPGTTSASSRAPTGAAGAAQDIVESDPPDNTDNTYTIDATIDGADQQSRILTVSPTEDDQYGARATILVPPSFDMSQFVVGDEEEFVVDQQPSGAYVLQDVNGLDDASADAQSQANDGP